MSGLPAKRSYVKSSSKRMTMSLFSIYSSKEILLMSVMSLETRLQVIGQIHDCQSNLERQALVTIRRAMLFLYLVIAGMKSICLATRRRPTTRAESAILMSRAFPLGRCADFVLLNKIDTVTPQQTETLKAIVRQLNPVAKVHLSGCQL